MRKLVAVITSVLIGISAFAQTASEILANMEKALTSCAESGMSMVVDVKVPILGTMSTKTYTLGDKARIETSMMGVNLVVWYDSNTVWTYNSESNSVTIENVNPDKPVESEGDAQMFNGIADGYDVSIKKESDTQWHILCKKSKSNPDNEAPKTMDVVVEKGSFNPVSLSAKISGVPMTMRDIAFGVTEDIVTFNQNQYPDAKIEDKR